MPKIVIIPEQQVFETLSGEKKKTALFTEVLRHWSGYHYKIASRGVELTTITRAIQTISAISEPMREILIQDRSSWLKVLSELAAQGIELSEGFPELLRKKLVNLTMTDTLLKLQVEYYKQLSLHDGVPNLWSEEDLYREITSNAQTVMGNRNFVLYGAAGSGKSETMRWLMNMISKTSKGPYMLRISRTELDPVKILQKILLKFKSIELADSVHHQWEDLRKKPVTLANHLVWASLGKLLSSDAEIIPLSYQLRPLLEKNLILNFSGIDNPEDFSGRTAELVSLEDLEILTRQCSIPIDIDCEQLRYEMTKEFENAILGGYNFVKTLKQISYEVFTQTGIRPVLLIDDLVQSLNIYSTELLDFFITMEEGNWDIIFGLTPSTFESTKKGRAVLERIANLDTFDDRLIKLWLSDELGHNSYFVDIDNCHHFAARYLAEVKKLGGFVCEQCNMIKSCIDLQMETSLNCTLAPFNKPFLRRIFKSLPTGKGKARYFIMALGQILGDMKNGNLVDALQNHIERELSLDHPDQIVRLVGEAFSSEKINNASSVKIKGSIISMFMDEKVKQDIVIQVSNLSAARSSVEGVIPVGEDVISELNTGKAAIRDWLEDREVNKELLKGLRLGIAHLCREVYQPNNIIIPNTSRLSPLLRWDQSVEGSKIPVKFQGIDDFQGINVSRDLGHTAYLLNYVHLKRGQGKEMALENALHSSDELHYIMFESRKLKEEIKSTLSKQMCMPIDEFAYNLFVILMEIGQGGSEVPNLLYTNYNNPLRRRYPRSMLQQIPVIPNELVELSRALFKDWFLLRESIYDSVRLIECGKKYKNSDPILELFKVCPDSISSQFKVGEIELRKFVLEIQKFLNTVLDVIKGNDSVKEIARIDQLLRLVSNLVHPTEHTELTSMLANIDKYIDKPVHDLPEWQNCVRLKSRIRRVLRDCLSKDESLKLESPIEIHRLLVQVQSLEQEHDYLQICNLMNFFEEVVLFVKESESKLNLEIELNGLSGYITGNSLWNKGKACLNLPVQAELGYIYNHLNPSIVEVYERRKYIQHLIQVSPYINYELFEEAKDAVLRLGPCIASLGQIPILRGYIWEVMERCENYTTSVEMIIHPIEYSGVTHQLVSDIIEAYKSLNSTGVCDLLVGIMKSFSSYLHRWSQIINHFEPVIPQLMNVLLNEIDLKNDSLSVHELLEKLLVNIELLMDVPLLTENFASNNSLNTKESNYIEAILKCELIELPLASPEIDEVFKFLSKFPNLMEEARVAIYI